MKVLRDRLSVLKGLLSRIKGLFQLISGLVPIGHPALGINKSLVLIADSIGELLVGLGGVHSEHWQP